MNTQIANLCSLNQLQGLISQFLLVRGPLMASLASLIWVQLIGLQQNGETNLG